MENRMENRSLTTTVQCEHSPKRFTILRRKSHGNRSLTTTVQSHGKSQPDHTCAGSAVGVNTLPLNVCTEVEAIIEIEEYRSSAPPDAVDSSSFPSLPLHTSRTSTTRASLSREARKCWTCALCAEAAGHTLPLNVCTEVERWKPSSKSRSTGRHSLHA